MTSVLKEKGVHMEVILFKILDFKINRHLINTPPIVSDFLLQKVLVQT